VTIVVRDTQVTDEQIDMLVERAAKREPESQFRITLESAVDLRSGGENYQFTDELARRAFEHELHLARLEGEIPGDGYRNAGEIPGGAR
jgi:hypothetical protein